MCMCVCTYACACVHARAQHYNWIFVHIFICHCFVYSWLIHFWFYLLLNSNCYLPCGLSATSNHSFVYLTKQVVVIWVFVYVCFCSFLGTWELMCVQVFIVTVVAMHSYAHKLCETDLVPSEISACCADFCQYKFGFRCTLETE